MKIDEADLQKAVIEIQQPTAKAAVPAAKPRGQNGRFGKHKTHAPSGREMTQFLREYLCGHKFEVLDTTGELVKDSKTRLERILDNQLFIASDSTVEARSASVKAAQLLMERSYGRTQESDESREDLQRQQVKTIFITVPQLPCQGELKPAEELRPHFDGAQPFIEGEVLYTNPQLSAAEMQPKVEVKKPEAKPKFPKAEEGPNPGCRCDTESPMYCPVHRPY